MQAQQLSKEQAQRLSPEAYDAYVAQLRREDFARLGDSVYADHAGAALYSERQLGEVFQVGVSAQGRLAPQGTKLGLLS